MMNKMNVKVSFVTALVGSALFTAGNTAMAVTSFDQNVTNNVIFGSGNANGSFTVDRTNGIELGLRAKLRFDASNQPQNIFNSNGDGTYTFSGGAAPGGFSFAQPPTTTPIWNFEWSVNTDFDGSTGLKLDNLTYELGIDFDPGPGTNFLTFDPITPVSPNFFDHSIGDNSTASGAGQEANSFASYTALLNGFNLAQNSWNMEFFNNPPFDTFDPNTPGTYDFFLRAIDANGAELARVDASVNVVVPEPVTAGLGLMGLGALALSIARRRRA